MDENIGKRIRNLRLIKNYTREEFAEIADISVKFLYDIESGKKGFSVDVLMNIAKGFSVSCDYILLGECISEKEVEKLLNSIYDLEPENARRIQDILSILIEMGKKK